MDTTQDVLKRLKTGVPSERKDAVEELRDGMGAQAVPYLVTALMDENLGVQQAAIDALIDIKSPAVVTAVIPLIGMENNASLRNMAAEILGMTGSEDMEAMTSLLKEEDSDIRRFAADIIGEIGDKQGVPALTEALEDKNPNVRSSAANSLGRIKDSRALEPLVRRLEAEREEWVKFSVIEALGKIGDKRIIVHLMPYLNGGNDALLMASAEALKKFSPGEKGAEEGGG